MPLNAHRRYPCVLATALALVCVGLGSAPADAALISVLERIDPVPFTYPHNVDASTIPDDHEPITGSPVGGTITQLQPVDLFSGTSGCEAADFAGFLSGTIALIERGGCTFSVKVLNAQLAGAVAALIFDNETPSDGGATLGGQATLIPSVFATEAIGEELAQLLQGGEVIIRLSVREVPDAVVAEPATLTLFSAALAGLALTRRRRIASPQGRPDARPAD